MLAPALRVMNHSSMSVGSPRQQALTLVRHENVLPAPSLPGLEAGSPEALEYLETIKVPHYAALARVIDLVLEQTIDQSSRRPPDGLIASPLTHLKEDEPWPQLQGDFMNTFYHDIDAVETHPDFVEAQRYALLIGSLNPNRYIDLHLQLYSGAHTAVTTMTGLLQGFPDVMQALAPDISPQSYPAIARHSVNLPARIALTCINRMMAARKAANAS